MGGLGSGGRPPVSQCIACLKLFKAKGIDCDYCGIPVTELFSERKCLSCNENFRPTPKRRFTCKRCFEINTYADP